MTEETPKEIKYIQQVWDIRTSDAVEAGSLAFMARCFIQATLPHSNPGDNVGIWYRENGNFSLTVKAGRGFDKRSKREVNYGLPFGSIPRLLLAWMTTEALRTNEPTLVLGRSLSEFMAKLGLDDPTGGRNGSITRLKHQMYRLLCAEITLSQTRSDGGIHEKDLKISNERMLFWNPLSPSQGSLWDSWISLSEEFFKTLTFNPAPLDYRVLRALKRSSMALDIYMWLTHRTYYLKKAQNLPWEALQAQIGSDYSDMFTFRFNVRKAVSKIRVFWPDLKVDFDDSDTIMLFPCKPLLAPSKRKS